MSHYAYFCDALPVPAETAGASAEYLHPCGKWVFPDDGGRPRYVWSDTSIPGYRGVPNGEAWWDPQKPPCVPSDHRPAHLFNSREAAEAAGAAARVERFLLFSLKL